MVLQRERVRYFLSSLSYAVVIILICVQFRWASFGLKDMAQWAFAGFAVVPLQAVLVYMLAALVLPDIAEAPVDLKQHYFGTLTGSRASRRWCS